jgi:CheY-like chemotaxis protein
MAGRILLVGEPDNELTELKISLESLGLEVQTAPDGLAALESGKEFQPDLVISEILTSRLSGFELSSRIGNGTAGFSAPVVFYTEFYRDEKARREVLAKYGAIHYFLKPFQKEILKKAVVTHFQDFLAQREAAVEALKREKAEKAAPAQASRAVASADSGPPALPGPAKNEVRAPNVEAQSGVNGFYPEWPSVMPTVTGPSEASLVNDGGERREQSIDIPAAADSESKTMFTTAPDSAMLRLLRSRHVWAIVALIVLAMGIHFFRRASVLKTQETAPPPTVDSQIEIPKPAQPAQTGESAQPSLNSSSSSPGTLADESPSAEPSQSTAPEVPDTGQPDRVPTVRRQSSLDIDISDVTGAGRGPYLRRMKRPVLPAEMLQTLSERPLVVRIVVNESGNVQEVVPLNPEIGELPAPVLAAIQDWRFSRISGTDQTTALKYYSFRAKKRE